MVNQTSHVLARTLYQVHQEFGLTHKVAAMTTDNGSNYVAAYSHYSSEEVPMDLCPVGAEEDDPDVVEPVVKEVHSRLEDVTDASLPPHFRC